MFIFSFSSATVLLHNTSRGGAYACTAPFFTDSDYRMGWEGGGVRTGGGSDESDGDGRRSGSTVHFHRRVGPFPFL